MVQKILRIITNNFGLKILAAVIAIGFWLVIVKVEDPDKSMTFTVQADMINAEYLTEQELTYEVLNESDYITFTVTGQRSIVTKLTSSDFVVTADISNIENNSQVPITISAKRYGNSITISKRSQYVEVFVENIITEKVKVEVKTTGNEADGYQVSELIASVQEILVTGPESIVDQICSAVATVEVNAMQADASTTAELVLYDIEGNEVESGRLSMNHRVVTVTIGVVEKKEVPLKLEVNGTPAAGYQVLSVSGEVETLLLLGKPDLIEKVDAIVVSGEEMSIAGANRTVEKDIDITQYLPEGISLVPGQDSILSITIQLEAETVTEYEVPVFNIQIQNIPLGFEVTPDQNTVKVSIQGYPSALSGITAESIKGTADASRVSEGSQLLSVQIAGDYELEGGVQMSVVVKKQASDTTTDGTQ